MKVLHTIPSMGAKSGGTSTATFELLSALNKLPLANGDAIDLVALSPDSGNGDSSLAEGCPWYREVPFDAKTPFVVSGNFRHFLRNAEYDVYHTNGMWLDVNHATCAIARKKVKPYLITPHGMLYPEALKRSAWKKWPMRKFFFDKDVRMASCVHVTCEAEMRHVRDFGYCGPIALIGNPVVCPPITERLLSTRNYKEPGNPLRLGYLGRLHPRKSVENLLRGYALCKGQIDAEIIVMGSGYAEYEAFLRAEAARLGIESKVKFLGFVSGDEKFRQLARLDALFVPSDMENFGMIIPEALLVGTPVMASLGTPWESLNAERCGWWTANTPESIAAVLHDINRLQSEELAEMGRRGRALVLNNFAASKVAVKMLNLYNWLLNRQNTPDFIYE